MQPEAEKHLVPNAVTALPACGSGAADPSRFARTTAPCEIQECEAREREERERRRVRERERRRESEQKKHNKKYTQAIRV